MFRAFLYNIKKNQLARLEEKEFLDCGIPAKVAPCSPLGEAEAFLWMDVTDPTPENMSQLAEQFGLDPQIVEDINGREGRPKLHDYDDYIYLVFHDIALKGEENERLSLHTEEVDCLLGPDWVITVHAKPLPAFDTLAGRWEKKPEWMKGGPPQLLYELMDAVLDGYFPVLEKIDESIDAFETRLLISERDQKENASFSSEIFGLKRVLLEIRHIAGPTRDVSNVLLRRDAEEGGKHFAAFQDLYDHSSRVVENIDTYRDILSGALDAYLAIESNKMNAIMKQLTAYSIILLVPTLIAGIYGMNFEHMPELKWRYGYALSLFVMGAIDVLLYFRFKRTKWL